MVAAIQAHAAEIIFLPRYNPDFNPHRRRLEQAQGLPTSRRRALARGLARITASNAHGWFQHAGYKTT